MASASFSIIPSSALMEGMEFSFCNLYLHHTYGGPKPNQSTIVSGNGSTGLGSTVANNWVVYDGLGSDAKAVAHAQGLHIYAGNWHNSFSLVFENERFKRSTLQVMGVPVEGGEWSIVGGTGEFAMASGVIYKKVHERRPEGNIIELTVHGFCTSLKGRKFVPIKVGPWGGNGGTPQDITETPKGLEFITVRTGTVVDSISFSYLDQAGQKRMAGPWGGPGGNPSTIEFASSEFLMEVSGTFGTYEGASVITSIKFVTNLKTHGPFGQQNGTPFTVPVKDNRSIVGFFGRGGKYLDALGVYVHPIPQNASAAAPLYECRLNKIRYG